MAAKLSLSLHWLDSSVILSSTACFTSTLICPKIPMTLQRACGPSRPEPGPQRQTVPILLREPFHPRLIGPRPLLRELAQSAAQSIMGQHLHSSLRSPFLCFFFKKKKNEIQSLLIVRKQNPLLSPQVCRTVDSEWLGSLLSPPPRPALDTSELSPPGWWLFLQFEQSAVEQRFSAATFCSSSSSRDPSLFHSTQIHSSNIKTSFRILSIYPSIHPSSSHPSSNTSTQGNGGPQKPVSNMSRESVHKTIELN